VRLGDQLSEEDNERPAVGGRVGIKPTRELRAWELPNRANP